MANRILLTALENRIKEHASGFEIKFKNESALMKIIGKILSPFNKTFMTSFKTTIGQKVYWPTRELYEANPSQSFNTLAHEFVHIMDYKLKPIRFTLGYLFPQILAAPGVLFTLLLPVWLPLMILSILSPWWLLFLVSLVFLAPIPSPGRKKAEVRGYGMSCLVRFWRFGSVLDREFNHYVGAFTGPAYYFMWPFKRSIEKQLKPYCSENASVFNDPNSAYKVVYNLLEEHGELHV